MAETLTVRSCAKVNLCLEVLGRRSDGYHELRTIFQAIDLADDLRLTRPAGARPPLIVSGLPAPVAGNLCLRAVEVFSRRVAIEPVAMKLHKRVPLGGGLGGGSSDAAGVLRALDHWYGPLPPCELAAMAAQLGSDVPFFLRGGTVLGRGRGEELQALTTPYEGWLVVVCPPVAVSTAAAYGALGPEDFSQGEHTAAIRGALERGEGLRGIAHRLYNAFERAVLAQYPAVARAKAQLLQAGVEAALLSGSGAALFGLCADESSARAAASHLTDRGLRAEAVRTVSAAPPITGT